LSTPVVLVIADAPVALGVQDGVVVVVNVNVSPLPLFEALMTVNEPTYADSLAPTGEPAMLTTSPALNGFDEAIVAVTVVVGEGELPVQASVRVRPESTVEAVRSTLGEPPASGVAGKVVIE